MISFNQIFDDDLPTIIVDEPTYDPFFQIMEGRPLEPSVTHVRLSQPPPREVVIRAEVSNFIFENKQTNKTNKKNDVHVLICLRGCIHHCTQVLRTSYDETDMNMQQYETSFSFETKLGDLYGDCGEEFACEHHR